MALVTRPKSPGKGLSRWKVAARCQSTDPESTRTMDDVNASRADTPAMGSDKRAAHLTPTRFTTVKMHTIAQANAETGKLGKNH